jgi:uncharacterized membrane protein
MRKIALAVLVLLFSTLCARADGFLFNNGSFTALQDPHFPSMTPSSINNKGTIVGGSFAGAFIDENGVITALNVPTPTGINDFGEIVGYGIPFLPGIGSQSFIDINGHIQTLIAPGADMDGAHGFTEAFGVNNSGEVVGTFQNGPQLPDGGANLQGFLYRNGAFTILNAPAATLGTLAVGINNLGQVVGDYPVQLASGSRELEGFLYSAGIYRTFSLPCTGAEVSGINDLGEIVGSCVGSQGFILSPGSATFLRFPDSVTTSANAINDFGEIVGAYTVPEPGTVLLIAIGLIGLCATRRILTSVGG